MLYILWHKGEIKMMLFYTTWIFNIQVAEATTNEPATSDRKNWWSSFIFKQNKHVQYVNLIYQYFCSALIFACCLCKFGGSVITWADISTDIRKVLIYSNMVRNANVWQAVLTVTFFN